MSRVLIDGLIRQVFSEVNDELVEEITCRYEALGQIQLEEWIDLINGQKPKNVKRPDGNWMDEPPRYVARPDGYTMFCPWEDEEFADPNLYEINNDICKKDAEKSVINLKNFICNRIITILNKVRIGFCNSLDEEEATVDISIQKIPNGDEISNFDCSYPIIVISIDMLHESGNKYTFEQKIITKWEGLRPIFEFPYQFSTVQIDGKDFEHKSLKWMKENFV